jgi:hypothetical protein
MKSPLDCWTAGWVVHVEASCDTQQVRKTATGVIAGVTVMVKEPFREEPPKP